MTDKARALAERDQRDGTIMQLRANLTLATRLLRRAVTELNHHVSYEDEETIAFLKTGESK